MMKNNKGFTLVEVLVVVIILGVVAMLGFGVYDYTTQDPVSMEVTVHDKDARREYNHTTEMYERVYTIETDRIDIDVRKSQFNSIQQDKTYTFTIKYFMGTPKLQHFSLITTN